MKHLWQFEVHGCHGEESQRAIQVISTVLLGFLVRHVILCDVILMTFLFNPSRLCCGCNLQSMLCHDSNVQWCGQTGWFQSAEKWGRGGKCVGYGCREQCSVCCGCRECSSVGYGCCWSCWTLANTVQIFCTASGDSTVQLRAHIKCDAMCECHSGIGKTNTWKRHRVTLWARIHKIAYQNKKGQDPDYTTSEAVWTMSALFV